jgi:GGDEF domain-containing protein
LDAKRQRGGADLTFPFTRLFEGKSRRQLLDKVSAQAEAGRRLAIYDRQTGLLAYWYIRHRFEEEVMRAARIAQPLSVVLLRVSASGGFAEFDRIGTWLSGQIRPYDLATHLGDGEFLVVMPETSVKDAEALVRRIASAVGGVVAGISLYPDDALSFDELAGVARSRIAA